MSQNRNTVSGSQVSAPVNRPRNMWGTIKRLAGYMEKSWPMIAAAIIATIAGTVMQVISPKMLGRATTIVFEGVRDGRMDFGALATTLLSVAAMYAGIFLMAFLQQRFTVVVSQKATYAMRNGLRAKMNRVPVSYFDRNANGALMSVAANDVENIVTNLQQSLTELLSSIILIVGIAWFMFSINALLALVTCIMVPCGLLIMKAFTPVVRKDTRTYFASMGELNAQVDESYQGFAVIKSFNGEEAFARKFGGTNGNMYQTGWRSRFLSSVMFHCIALLYNLIYVAVAVIGSMHVIKGTISIGDMQAFLQYSTQFSIPFTRFTQLWGNALSVVASAERVFQMLDADEMVEYEARFPNADEASKVVFEHMEFGYGDEPLMKDFSMQVANGQMTAIVGHTGAGKTTLVNLLERFYEIQGGAIRVDGVDIRNIDRQALRRRMGMVLQDTWLFSGTIYDNIRFGKEDATQDEIIAAAKAANADDFIAKLPNGYDTMLGEDADNISQGQRQLLTIARAFVSNPEMLILDEATSNVDSRTESVIQGAMKRLLKGRTSFVIAHRLSTIQDADLIVVMDHGDVAETGTHGELIAANGTYADIYNSQFAGLDAQGGCQG